MIVFVVERKLNGEWRVVATGIEADGAEAASVAVARVADAEGVYRVTGLGRAEAPATFRVPAYGLPVRIQG